MNAMPTVLVLDDDPAVRKTLVRRLRSYNYDGVPAETLDEAYAVLGTTPVQALILDVGLEPGQSGLDLLIAIRNRKEFAEAPILIFTGQGLSDQDKAVIRRHGAYLFQKPEGFDSLIQFLDTLTGRDQSH
jgi:DNA-binding response OmpR family regulator